MSSLCLESQRLIENSSVSLMLTIILVIGAEPRAQGTLPRAAFKYVTDKDIFACADQAGRSRALT